MENETDQENKVFGSQSTYNLMEMKGQNFLSQMYHEVIFRKKNDMDFDYLTRNDTKEQNTYKAKRQKSDLMKNERAVHLRARSRICDMTNNQNDGAIFKESNKSAFMLRRKTREFE